jgi:hypothetical protein
MSAKHFTIVRSLNSAQEWKSTSQKLEEQEKKASETEQ